MKCWLNIGWGWDEAITAVKGLASTIHKARNILITHSEHKIVAIAILPLPCPVLLGNRYQRLRHKL